MSSAATIPPLTGTVTVDGPVDRAFRIFTDAFGSWWPAEYHIVEHRLLERLDGGQALRDGITGGGGWTSLLELFAKAATNQA
jgi:uncharacterized protein YndB with AHSA1/START domain